MFTLDRNGTCVSICPIPNCRVCSSFITCAACNIGFVPISSYQCSSICNISNCLLCNDPFTCAVCSDGFSLSLSNNSCNIKCLDNNCVQCSSLDSCLTCASGFLVTVDDIGKGICIKKDCSIGLYPNSTNSSQCLPCSLSGCDVCSSINTCSSCQPTYYLTNASCVPCTAYSNCLVCNEIVCLQCQTGYVKNSQNACIMLNSCSSGCLSCTNGTCMECSSSYFLNNNICTPKCSSGVFMNGICACSLGLYMNNGACIACRDSKCLYCDQIKCNQCISGYYPLLDVCAQCISNCDKCSSAAICDQCQSGYTLSEFTCKFNYLNPISTNQCPLGCAKCTFFHQIPYCIKLDDGFAFAFNSSIIQCASSCKTCASNNPNLCLSCYYGLLNYGTCSSCNDSNC
jgi:hypothetical protein